MKELFSPKGLVVVAVLFLSVNLISSLGLKSARVDLTENGLYNLTQGSRNILAEIDEPVTAKLFYSKDLLAEIPQLATYGRRVRELLEEFSLVSGGLFQLQVIDPEPFSDAEDEAVEVGLRAVPANTKGELAYFGLLATSSTDQRVLIPFFDPSNEQFLEYDLAKMVYQLDHPERPVVGVLTSLPALGGPPQQFPGAPPPRPPWFVIEQLAETFDVRPLDPAAGLIPDDVDVLLVIHPKGFPDATLYAIDQFVLGGGKAMVCVDPHSEEDRPPQDPNNPLAGMEAVRDSDLGPILPAWGLELVEGKVLADRNAALAVNAGGQRGAEPVDYIVWLGLDGERLDGDDPVTGDLSMLRMPAVGMLRPVEGAATTVTPLVTSSTNSGEVAADNLKFFPDPKRLLNEFEPTGRSEIIAARIVGPAGSAYPDGPPEGVAPPPAGEDGSGGHLAASTEPIHVIVVSDADFLADGWWVSFQNMLGMRIPRTSASNGAFALNAIDSLGGSTDLVSVRSRGDFQRRFVVMDELRDEAEERFLETEQALNDELAATEARLNELQSQRADGSSAFLTAEQQAEVDDFLAKKVETRKKLRNVRYELGKDVEGLQGRLKFLNIFGVPLLVLLAAFIRSRMR